MSGSAQSLPQVLGLDKRKLLREEVLRDISRNRSNQRLVNEFAELLDEIATIQDEPST